MSKCYQTRAEVAVEDSVVTWGDDKTSKVEEEVEEGFSQPISWDQHSVEMVEDPEEGEATMTETPGLMEE